MSFQANASILRIVPFSEGYAILGGMCHFGMNVPFLEECALFMCHVWRNVPFWDEFDIFGGMCHFWRNVSFLEECAIFG